ncbi:MAG: hypothetical protein U0892_06055 [Pirellulales bacterium]
MSIESDGDASKAPAGESVSGDGHFAAVKTADVHATQSALPSEELERRLRHSLDVTQTVVPLVESHLPSTSPHLIHAIAMRNHPHPKTKPNWHSSSPTGWIVCSAASVLIWRKSRLNIRIWKNN